jgi:hypothetical protein
MAADNLPPDTGASPDSFCNPAEEPPARRGESGSTCTEPDPGRLTLEQIVEMTGEFEHLNELVLLRLERSGGFTGTEAYFKTVHPLLDMLEIEIRVKCTHDTTAGQMTRIVREWIDREISELK